MLNARLNELGACRARLDKATFVKQLCSAWHDGLKPENVISGFKSTGIYPVDSSQYPQTRFDARLLKRYHNWVQSGKPSEVMVELATSISTPSKAKTGRPQPAAETGTEATEGNSEVEAVEQLQSTPSSYPDSTATCKCDELGPVPHNAPPGTRWKPIWNLVAEENDVFGTSFEELLLDRIKPKSTEPKPKRMKVDLTAKLVTHHEYLAALKEKEEKVSKKQKKKKNEDEEMATSLVSDKDADNGAREDEREESEKEEEAEQQEEESFPTTQRQVISFLKENLESLKPSSKRR